MYSINLSCISNTCGRPLTSGCIVILTVHPIELVSPHLFDIAGVDETMTIGRLLNEHHRWEVIEMPVGRNIDEIGLMAPDEWLHPLLGALRVVNFRPAITSADIVGVEVVMHQ